MYDDVIDDNPERINISYMCNYKSMVFVAKTLELIFIFDYHAHELLLQMFSLNFLTHFLTSTVQILGLYLSSFKYFFASLII